MCSAELGTGSFGAFTFFAREHGAEECDSHGLPLTPNTILITGLFQQLKEMPHPFLCEYLDLMKCDSERMICVSEYYIESLESHLLKKISVPIVKLSCQITQALSYLHNKDITVRTLSPDTILFTPEGNVKLLNYGFYHMTNNGTAVDFPIGSPRYLAPELLLLPDNNDVSVAIATKSDIWSLGIILTEVFMESHIYPDLFLKNGLKTLFTRILRLVQNHQRGSASPLLALLDTHGLGDKPIDPPLKEFIEYCLSPQPSQRYSARSLLSLSLIKSSKYSISQKCPSLRDPFSKIVFDSSKVELSSLPSNNLTLLEANVVLKEDYLITCSMKEVYFLWGLAGGGLQSELQKSGVIQKQLPILNIPCVVSKEGEELGMKRNKVHLYDSTVIPLPMDQLRTRLETKSVEDFYPILSDPEEKANDRISIVSTSEHLAQSAKLPLLIKERDIDYQFHRLILYRRLLEGYPYTNEMIITEAIIDVCPLVRGPIWAALLNIQGDIHTTYINIDKVSETQTDRQIAVDIPRCHQYDLLLASSEGHQKFMRILKAWVVAHPKLVYWQGLDSLCAPFLSLNFNNEALAYSSLCGFINKYLHHFFLKDNSYIMQEYLAVFSQIIAYDDPEVFNHLDNIGFHPDLYAIPWFLTMFTHVFPLHKIYHLWDTLLLGNTSFPLFAGLGILIQLRSELLNSGFNECIMMFSDLPDIDIHQCLMEAVQRYQATPSSLCVRQYDVIPIQHSAIPQEARKEPLSLDVLKMECSPQISAHDFLTLCKLEHNVHWYTNMTPPPRKDPNNPLLWRQLEENVETQEVIVLDIRSEEEYRQGHVPNSLNLPHTEAFFTDGSLAPSPVTTYLQEEQHKGHIIVIVANKHDPGPTFARQLVRLNFSHVCLLHGGAGILHSLGILSSV